jgi:hypothetical protein
LLHSLIQAVVASSANKSIEAPSVKEQPPSLISNRPPRVIPKGFGEGEAFPIKLFNEYYRGEKIQLDQESLMIAEEFNKLFNNKFSQSSVNIFSGSGGSGRQRGWRE